MKTPIALKLDFKIDEKGRLRIFDIGDGLAAGLTGFEDTPVSENILYDLYNANQSALTTVFGELPLDAMQPKTMHIPVMQRKETAKYSCMDIRDLSQSKAGFFLPYSYAARIQSYVAHFWAKKSDRVVKTSLGLMGMEMHKLLWYTLMKKHMPSEYGDTVVYWSNDNPNVKIDLSRIDITNGVFIKIGDRSTGGGSDVYYAKDSSEVSKILGKLHHRYQTNREAFRKHIFVIEPAYQTIKTYGEKNYNVTGRAFVTLIFDSETRKIQVKFAGAKWMFPEQSLQKHKTPEQMISNAKHSIGLQALNQKELDILSQQIVEIYGDVFAASIENDDMVAYCKDGPDAAIVKELQTTLRPNASYKLVLDSTRLKGGTAHAHQEQLLMHLINSIVFTHYLPKDLSTLLAQEKKAPSFFSKKTTTQSLIRKICQLSFLEGYTKFIKTCNPLFRNFPKVIPIIKNESLITLKLDALIKQFLQVKGKHYDLMDLNRALRQSAYVSDIEVMKLLIGTHRASVNACSPKTKQTALDFAIKSKSESDMKDSCMQLLMQNGAQAMQSPVALDLVRQKSSCVSHPNTHIDSSGIKKPSTHSTKTL